MENNKQTAVEWLVENVAFIQVELKNGNSYLIEKIEEAKEMEKEQMMDAIINWPDESFDSYYERTYGKGETK